jgi:uroporphyrinogen-III synthase
VNGRLVWVTRAQPGAAATASRVRAMGFEPLVAPLLDVRALPGGPVDLNGVAALAFTSVNGVAAFAARSEERRLPVFAVGRATAGAAREAGFAAVTSADGDVADLAAAIAARAPFAGDVLHLRPAEAAGDLVGDLANRGVQVRSLPVYETVACTPEEATVGEIPKLTAVLLHSPKAARALAAHLVRQPTLKLAALCFSEAVAAPLRAGGLAAIRVAAAPNETALLSLLSALETSA